MNDDALRRNLQAWQLDPTVPRAFHARVWERIAEREDARIKTPLGVLRAWLLAQMLHPARAAALALLVMVAGVAGGVWKGAIDREHRWADLERRYVDSIDPYARMTNSRTP